MGEGGEEEVAGSGRLLEVASHTIVINARDLPEMSQHFRVRGLVHRLSRG